MPEATIRKIVDQQTLDNEELRPDKHKKLLLFGNIVGAGGVRKNIPLDTPRFMHYDIDRNPTSMQFQRLNGWVIFERLVPLMMFCLTSMGLMILNQK